MSGYERVYFDIEGAVYVCNRFFSFPITDFVNRRQQMKFGIVITDGDFSL